MSKNDRILIVKCSNTCRYLRGPIDPFDDPDMIYCAYNPHSSWESTTKDECARCERAGRFPGVEISKAITVVEKALKKHAEDTEIITDRELAEIAIDTLLGLNK